ncbi:MAG: cobaltochelatase subunit CobN [Mediterranea sp.]|jgi:cobaltochelatase CobN|nr:cobaltochelatase subunit CobN [Mediterranea sp.]
MTRITKRTLGISALSVLILMTLSVAGYDYWFSPTRILVVNTRQAPAADITLNNDSRHIRVTCLPTEEVTSFDGYDAVAIYARGLHFSEEQVAALERIAKKGIPVFTIASRSTLSTYNFNMQAEPHERLLAYFNNANLRNYRNALRYLRHIATPHKIPEESFGEPVILPDNHYYHREYGKYFGTKEALTHYLKEKKLYHEGGKNIAFISGVNFPMEGNRAHVDTLITLLTREGFNIYPIASPDKRTDMIRDLHPDAIVYYPMGRLGNDTFIEWLNAENIPLFCPYPLIQSTEEWLDPMLPVSGGTLNGRVLVPEIDGAMYPLAVATQNPHESGYYLYTPEEERMNHFVRHLRKYTGLADKPNKDKRIAICYFRTPGKDALLASGMEVIPSLYNVLNRLKAEGYDLTGLPATLNEFKQRINRDGLVLGSYAKGAQEAFLSQARPLWLTRAQYEEWAREALAPHKYQEVTDRYGEAPGELLVRAGSNGEKQIAIACIQFGNVLLYPQPRPALGDDDFKLVHGVPVAPPHSYLAPYLYMRKGFGADALIHFGTHGNLEYTPGKNVALSKNDWADVLVGDLPHFYLYTTGNVGEGIIAKRRTHAVLITHLTPPYVESGMRRRYASLLDDVHHLLSEGDRASRTLALQVKKEVMKLGLHRDLELDSVPAVPYTAGELEKLDLFMEEIANEKITGAFYTLGEPYAPRDLLTTTLAVSADPLAYKRAKRDMELGKITAEQLQDFSFVAHRYLPQAKKELTALLQNPPEDTAGVNPELREALMHRELLRRSTRNELTSILRALNGGRIHPAPGGDPVLNPNVLPTGRNMFGINAENTPTKRSWEEGTQLAESTLKAYREKHGEYPRKVSYTFWAGEFINSEGATVAQAFRMLGVEPVRDNQERIVDIKLTPSTELGRPRINVVVQVSGQLRDIAGSRLKLLTEAVRLASAATGEPYPNFVAEGTVSQEKTLIDKGMSPRRAREMAAMRVFGPVNSGYSTGMIAYTDNSGKWDSENQLVNGYLNNMGAIYGDDENWGVVEKELFATALQETEVIIQPRQSNTWGPISLDHVFEFTGAMSLAVRTLTGKEPEAYMADYRNRNCKRMQNLKEAVAAETRATILNPVFVRERMKGDATTAQMFGKIFRNIFGWHVMRPSAMDTELYNDLYRMYVADENNLGLQEYFDRVNPAARQVMTAVMLESARKGYWKPTEEQLGTTAGLHAYNTAKHGAACTEVVCDNGKLQQFIAQKLPSQQAQAYNQQMQSVHESANADDRSVVLKQENRRTANEESKTSNDIFIVVIVTVLLLLLIIRLKRRKNR